MLRTRRTHLSAVCLSILGGALAVSACNVDDDNFATVSQAIYHGARDAQVVNLTPGEKLAIGFLAGPEGDEFCTATLIDRDLVVTASHCTEESGPRDIRFGIGNPEDPIALLAVAKISEHPDMDAALLFLTDDAVSSVSQIEPLPSLRSALPSSMIGQRVEAAGYGETHDGSRGLFFAALTLKEVDSTDYIVDGGGQQGICYGDSGGPLLVSLEGNTVVAAVESWGDESCVDVDHMTRLDLVTAWMDSEQASFDPNAPIADRPSNPSSSGDDDGSWTDEDDGGESWTTEDGDWDSGGDDEWTVSQDSPEESGCSATGRTQGIDGLLLFGLVVPLILSINGFRRKTKTRC